MKKAKYFLTLLPFLAVVLLFEMVPLVTIFANSVKLEGSMGFTLENFARIFSKKLYQAAIVNSIMISLVSAAIGIVIAMIAARAAQNAKGKLQNFFASVLNITSNFAGVPLAFSYMIMMGNSGIMVLIGKHLGISALANFDLYSTNGLMIMYIYFQIPLGTLLMIPAFGAVKKQWKEAASLMRANTLQFWFHIGIPVLLPSILGTFSVLFSNALAAYATAYALLASNYPLLPTSISNLFVGDIIIRKELGSALSVVMMALMSAAVLINNYFSKRSRKEGIS